MKFEMLEPTKTTKKKKKKTKSIKKENYRDQICSFL